MYELVGAYLIFLLWIFNILFWLPTLKYTTHLLSSTLHSRFRRLKRRREKRKATPLLPLSQRVLRSSRTFPGYNFHPTSPTTSSVWDLASLVSSSAGPSSRRSSYQDYELPPWSPAEGEGGSSHPQPQPPPSPHPLVAKTRANAKASSRDPALARAPETLTPPPSILGLEALMPQFKSRVEAEGNYGAVWVAERAGMDVLCEGFVYEGGDLAGEGEDRGESEGVGGVGRVSEWMDGVS